MIHFEDDCLGVSISFAILKSHGYHFVSNHFLWFYDEKEGEVLVLARLGSLIGAFRFFVFVLINFLLIFRALSGFGKCYVKVVAVN